jgi:hypothetical protein
MALAIYYVMRGGDGWIVRLDDRDYGHTNVTSALRAAIAAARTSAGHGHEVQVLVQRPDGPWSVSWTSEDDFMPAVAGAPADSEASLSDEPAAADR